MLCISCSAPTLDQQLPPQGSCVSHNNQSHLETSREPLEDPLLWICLQTSSHIKPEQESIKTLALNVSTVGLNGWRLYHNSTNKAFCCLIPQRPELELRRCLSKTVAPTDIIQIKRSHCVPGWPRYSPESTSSRSDETKRNHSSRLTLVSAPPSRL